MKLFVGLVKYIRNINLSLKSQKAFILSDLVSSSFPTLQWTLLSSYNINESVQLYLAKYDKYSLEAGQLAGNKYATPKVQDILFIKSKSDGYILEGLSENDNLNENIQSFIIDKDYDLSRNVVLKTKSEKIQFNIIDNFLKSEYRDNKGDNQLLIYELSANKFLTDNSVSRLISKILETEKCIIRNANVLCRVLMGNNVDPKLQLKIYNKVCGLETSSSVFQSMVTVKNLDMRVAKKIIKHKYVNTQTLNILCHNESLTNSMKLSIVDAIGSRVSYRHYLVP